MGYGERLWHFTEATLPAEWTSVVGGNAAVFMYDHGVKLDSGSGAASDTAAITMPFDRTRALYQRITVCVRSSASAFRPGLRLQYRVGGPIPDSLANVEATELLRWYTYSSAGLYYGQGTYWTTGATKQHWSDATKAWGATNVASTPLLSEADDYHILGIDWDDALDRVRLFWVHVASGSTFASEPHGPKLFALTDWVDLSTIRNGDKTSDLWLTIGWLFNMVDLAGATQHIEWVRHEWADELIPHYCNIKPYDSGSGYKLRAYSSLRADGVKLPVSRTGLALDTVAATFESLNVGQWGSVTRDPATGLHWMTYNAHNGTDMTIGLASATDPFGTWTKYASNPILPREAATHYDQKVQSCLVCDRTEPDPAKRWKLVVSCLSALDGHLRVYLYTASQPDTLSWTREGLLIDWDAGNLDGDMGPELYAPPLYRGGRWYLHYVALHNAATWGNYVAVGDRLAAGAFTPNRSVNYLDRADGVEMTVSAASSTSRTVTVSSTTGVQKDDFVVYDEDASVNNWRLGRVRKVVDATTLELYHRMPGISTAGVLRTIRRGKQYVHHHMPFGDGWLWQSTMFAPMFLHATFGALYEGTALLRSTDPPPLQKPTYDAFNSPGWWLGRDGDTGSTENPRFVSLPVDPYTQSLAVRRRRRRVHLRR